LVISYARPVFGFPPVFQNIVTGDVLGISIPILITLFVAFIFYLITIKTVLGQNLYIIGGNLEVSWLSGVNVKIHKLVAFMFSGIASGIGGVVMIGRLGAAEPLAGNGLSYLQSHR